MVRVGSKQKNIYVELNEVGIQRISARPHKVESQILMGSFGSNIKNQIKINLYQLAMCTMGNFNQIFLRTSTF